MKLMAFDVETWGAQPLYGLQPFRRRTGEAGLSSYAVASFASAPKPGEPKPPVVKRSRARPTSEGLRGFLRATAQHRYTLTTWNGPFDIAWLLAEGLEDEVFANKWLDGMLLYRHVINVPTAVGRPGVGLKEAVAKFYPDRAGYEQDIDYDYNWRDDPEGRMPQLLAYNEEDADHTLNLTWDMWQVLTPEQRRCALIEAQCLPIIAQTRLEGIEINAPAALELKEKLAEQRKLAFVKLCLQDGEVSEETLASPKQLGELLYDKWHLPVPHWTEPTRTNPTGSPSTDKEALAALAVDYPMAREVHLYREATNNTSKFCDGALVSAEYNGDGRSRPEFRIFGTYTGRGTYSSKVGRGVKAQPSGCALHQWKRGAEYRRVIKAPEGYDLLEWDFAGQEFRWMAVLSQDTVMLSLCEPGQDAHGYMGSQIAGEEYKTMLERLLAEEVNAKRYRQLGKVANLSLQYRTSAPTLQKVAKVQHGIPMSIGEAMAIHATYLAAYPQVRNYWKRQIKFGKDYGYVTTLAGRRVLTPRDMFAYGHEKKWAVESTCINFPIQGIGGDQKYLAFLLLRDYLPQVDGRVYFELHDGLFAIVPKAKSMKASEHVTKLLSNMPYGKAWDVHLPIQFPVDPKIGETWGDLKGVKF